MDDFIDSIHMEIIPCLWEMLSPLNDHMADTTLPLIMLFASKRPGFFHKTVSQLFHDDDWEVRFSALDPIFGLFSKLDDALVMKLFFRQTVPTTSPLGTMQSGKGKGNNRGQRNRDRSQHQTRTGTSSFEPETSESSGTGLSGQARRGASTLHGEQNHPSTYQTLRQSPLQQSVLYSQFLPEQLQILGPAFSFFVSSMWDKEEAVRTKARTLLKSLQPVHVCHALKAWELHFIDSPPEIQQTLLKLMTRLNNYFPGWKIMDYSQVFRLLTSGTLGRPTNKGSSDPFMSGTDTGSVASDPQEESRLSGSGVHSQGISGRRPGRAPVGSFIPQDSASDNIAGDALAEGAEPIHPHHGPQPSIAESSVLDVPPMAFMPSGEPSRSKQRASIVSASSVTTTSEESLPAMTAEAEERERQLALEDDIHCSLLNLALQMAANGIEPRLDEVIQLKYLVVFYLDFEGCELLSLGQGKFQVRYGEYIPRQRTTPLYEGEEEDLNGNVLLNDPGHESFVMVICKNLQLILDRYVEIKPDYEKDAPTLYDRLQSRDTSLYGGGMYGYEGVAMQSDLQTQVPQDGRTFSATTTTSRELSNEGTQDGEDEYGQEHYHRRYGLFCFPRYKHHQDDHYRNHHHHVEDPYNLQSPTTQKSQYQQAYYSLHGQHTAPLYQQHHHHHYHRNQNRRLDENAPVVGTYFVDVILRFFGSETDLSALPAGRLKNWLELLLIVIYKYVKEVDPLSDLVIVLMKRIVEMLMGRKSGLATTAAAAPVGVNGANGNESGGAGGTGNVGTSASPSGEESMSEENILLAISICSTLLKRSSTMTTALLSREIMAMGRLMTKRRDDPEDPVLIRAQNFLHDAFVHFMGNGLFVLVFKTQPAHITNTFGWEEEGWEVDQELDLFYVLAAVLGEDEMVPLDPTSTSSSANGRLVHFRDQPIRDILDRVMIFRDLEPIQVSTILTNLALYIERVHSKFEDPHLLPDMGQFLIKITKYTAEWDHQQHQKQKEQIQQLRMAQEQQQRMVQEQQQHQQFLQQQAQMKSQAKYRTSQALFSTNTSTMLSSESSLRMSNQHQQELQPEQKQKQVQTPTQTPILQQKEGVLSMTSGSTVVGVSEPSTAPLISLPALPASAPLSTPKPVVEAQRRNTATSITLTPTTPSSSSTSTPARQEQSHQLTHQSTIPSSTTFELSPSIATPKPSFVRSKSDILKTMTSFDSENSPFAKLRNNRQENTHDGFQALPQQQQSYHHDPHLHLHSRRQPSQKSRAHRQVYGHHWDYSNAVLRMCSILMIQNPLKGHHLIAAIKHVLRQALYRDKISAPALIRIVTGYCYMAELDFSLSLVNIFGEFVVEEMKTSIQHHAHAKHDDHLIVHHKNGIEGQDLDSSRRNSVFRRSSGKESEKEKEHAMGAVNLGLGAVNLGVGVAGVGGGYHPGGRTKILASNLHLLHHLLIWDLDPNYNQEWTQIKWEILGSMRFPPGHPILFPGANEALRQTTASIISDWADRCPS
ncbi:hypothetical protein BC939DRAFT_472272 [Gamsiella multidivaricata]|uniref:uncharacterized protein n=1 Tax=Gamsiella multidivaricata TaxID=101098 RepID=UPI0022206077|nr:uncharacterized protein BC939DRAFT_472272 [Gamsiella multidivaricata]KAI7832681.1 hypothetical protein BC939DRAFT_472272 [Gamsiella multidivaricata]